MHVIRCSVFNMASDQMKANCCRVSKIPKQPWGIGSEHFATKHHDIFLTECWWLGDGRTGECIESL